MGTKVNENETPGSDVNLSDPILSLVLAFPNKGITQFLGYPANHLPLDNEFYPYNLLDINPSQQKYVILEWSSNTCSKLKPYPPSGRI